MNLALWIWPYEFGPVDLALWIWPCVDQGAANEKSGPRPALSEVQILMDQNAIVAPIIMSWV